MVLDETMNDPNLRFEGTAQPQSALPQLALMPLGNDYSPNPLYEGSGWQDGGLPFLFFDDEDSDEEEDMDEEENFDDMDEDFDDDFDDDEDEDDFEDEDDDYEDEDDDDDYDYEEDVDYDDFDE